MTRNYRRYVALLVSLLLVASVTLPGAVAGAVAENDDLTLEVTQDHDTGEVLVTLEDNDTDEVNATLDVSGDSYVGNGSHNFSANGTLTLDAPTQEANVTFYAENNASDNVSVQVDLIPYADSLSISTDQTADGVEVLVEQYGEPVEGATVNASATDENETYQGAGEETTGADGTAVFENPAKNVTVDFDATYNDLNASTTEELQAYELHLKGYQDANNSVIIEVQYGDEPAVDANVTVDGHYTDAGEYNTDENGTVTLNAPTNDTTINVTAEYEGMNASIEGWAIQAQEIDGGMDFAKALVEYIQYIKTEGVEVPGQHISAFVHENNPSSADDDAHAGPNNPMTASSNSSHGPPAWAGPGNNSTTEDGHGPSQTPPGQAKDKGNGNGHGGNPHVSDETNESEP